MSKTSTPRELRELSGYLKTVKGETISYRQVFEHLNHGIPLTEGLIVTTLPRGSLQIAQPQRLAEPLLRAYSKEFHLEDRLSWQAIARGRTLRARECWPDEQFQSSRFFNEFIRVHGFAYAAVAPLSAPVLEGYPGALHVYRSEDFGDFSDAEIERLAQVAEELDEAIGKTRASRRVSCRRVSHSPPPAHQFIFDRNLNLTLPTREPDTLDQRLRSGMHEYARMRLGHVNGKQIESDRVSLPDSHGDLWNFRIVVHREYPALGEGPFVFFCLQPACGDWSSLRPTDFQADAEVARLVPAMKFMRENFQRGPTLTEIARMVHLSPFHFHRRFTELFGITPKHFMLDCQIEQAKTELLAREKELADIATACGFAHQSHFTSRFKQATGMTPTRWRRVATEAANASRN